MEQQKMEEVHSRTNFKASTFAPNKIVDISNDFRDIEKGL